MANLLTRNWDGMTQGDIPGRQTWRVVDGKKVEFNLLARLRDGTMAFAGYEVISLLIRERPFIRERAELRALEIAGQYGFDYAMLAENEISVGINDRVDRFLAQFYVETNKR